MKSKSMMSLKKKRKLQRDNNSSQYHFLFKRYFVMTSNSVCKENNTKNVKYFSIKWVYLFIRITLYRYYLHVIVFVKQTVEFGTQLAMNNNNEQKKQQKKTITKRKRNQK